MSMVFVLLPLSIILGGGALADVLLTRSELKGISELVRLARISRRTILQNLSLSLGYNTLTIPLAMMG